LAFQPVVTRHSEHHVDGTHSYRIGLQVLRCGGEIFVSDEKVARELTADQLNSDPVNTG
jgi:hypothetical protein